MMSFAPFFIIFSGALMSSDTVAQDTAFCAIIQNPQAFDGKMIRFRASVLTDWMHFTGLIHSGCKLSIELTSTDQVPLAQKQALDEAIGTPVSGGFDRRAVATFTGRFTFSKKDPQDQWDSPRKFTAVSVENIKIYRQRMPR